MTTSSPTPTLYGATSTTTFTTTITASPNESSVTILYPNPPIISPLQFTTIYTPLKPSNQIPSVLPILVLTDVVGIVISTDGHPLNTGTLIQMPNAQSSGISDAGDTTAKGSAVPCSAWRCWTAAQRAGTIAAAILIGFGIIGLIWWGFYYKPRVRITIAEGGIESRRRKTRGPISQPTPQTNIRPKQRRKGSMRRRSDSISSLFSSLSGNSAESRPRDPPMTVSSGPSSEYSSVPVTQSQRPRQKRTGLRVNDSNVSRNPSPPCGVQVRDFAEPVVLAARGSRRVRVERSRVPRGERYDPQRRESRQKRPRHRSQPPRRPEPAAKTRDKREHRGWIEVLASILPDTLRTIHKLAEPEVGLEEYHKKVDRRGQRSSSLPPQASKRQKQRVTSIDRKRAAGKRKSYVSEERRRTSIDPNSTMAPAVPELPKRRRSTRQDARDHMSERNNRSGGGK